MKEAGAIQVDSSGTSGHISEEEFAAIVPEVEEAFRTLKEKTGPGSELLGWWGLPRRISKQEIEAIEEQAREIASNSQAMIVVGIGGSYLGARAALESLRREPGRQQAAIYFAGHNLSSDYVGDLLDFLAEKKFSVNVISKSGTTTEPSVVFRILKAYMEKRFGKEESRKRIIATTDKSSGALRELADHEGYRTLVIPGDVGGRFSVLTPVGLLPMAVAGINIRKVVDGARDCEDLCHNPQIKNNPAATYAAIRNLLYRKGKIIEVLANYLPSLHSLSEWWKQLFGETEGKLGKGIFPAAVDLTTDLHSLGQWLQEGPRIFFETVLWMEKESKEVMIPPEEEDLDGLNYLSGKSLHYVNQQAMEGTCMAHRSAAVPVIRLKVPLLDGYFLGQLFYFFEVAAALSACILGVNPFDQPGVEAYKKNMFALLGKPGFKKTPVLQQEAVQGRTEA